MALEIEGKLVLKLAIQTGKGANGEWKKQDFVIETSGDYPKKICFSAWGDKSEALARINEGSHVKVSFEPNSREYQGKWYTDLRAWKIETLGARPTTETVPPPSLEDIPEDDGSGDLPF